MSARTCLQNWGCVFVKCYSITFQCIDRTPLKQENTLEYKKREAHAAKLAQEIEKSDSYKRRIALEVGDGDEEEKFSSVVRPGEQGGSGKYVILASDTLSTQYVKMTHLSLVSIQILFWTLDFEVFVCRCWNKCHGDF